MFLFLWFHLSSVCGDMRFTNDKPKDSIKASLGDNVPLRWTFTYNHDGKNSAGPWRARGVHEIIFGQWKSTYGKILFFEKIVAVDNGGNFTVRDGNKDKIDWNFSKYQLTFTKKTWLLRIKQNMECMLSLAWIRAPWSILSTLKLWVNKSAKIKAQMSEMVSLNNTIMSLIPLTKRKCDCQRIFAFAHKNTKISLL